MTVCVNCGSRVVDGEGREVEEVFDQKLQRNTGIIKLIECRNCKEYVDKYIGRHLHFLIGWT